MTVKELKEFISGNFCRRTGFTNEHSYYSKKHQKKQRFATAYD